MSTDSSNKSMIMQNLYNFYSYSAHIVTFHIYLEIILKSEQICPQVGLQNFKAVYGGGLLYACFESHYCLLPFCFFRTWRTLEIPTTCPLYSRLLTFQLN